MSSRTTSRTECAPVASLADLLAFLKTANLPERKRQELASAVRTAARALGRSPEDIPADGRLLANRLREVAPAAIGISRGRWNNVRALLRAALNLVKPISPGRHRNDLSSEWAALWNQLVSRSDKIALSRVLHYFSARRIGPHAVTEEMFDEYRLHLDRSFLKRPNQTFASTVRAWRRAEAAIRGWPQITLLVLDRRKKWVHGWDRFPEALRLDCQAWCDRLAGSDLLEDAPFRPVRPVTMAHRDWQIRCFASALVRRGRDPATLTSLSNLVEIDAFKDGLRFFLDREGGSPTTAIADLASSLKAIAKHHVRVGPDHLDRIGSIIRHRLSAGRRGLTEANRRRLRAFDDGRNLLALLRLPEELMRQARRHRNPQRGAVRAQMAVAVEILLMAPIRLYNLTNLDIERNLIRPGQGKALHIVIGAEEVKNREPLEYPLPPESVELVERYIREFRPHLTSADNTALFPGVAGGPKNQAFFGTQITRTIYAHTGLHVHPHLFRHIAAKLFLDANPGAYEVVRRVLGHRSIDTTTGFYTGLETPAAVRHFDKTILRLRGEERAEGHERTRRTPRKKRTKRMAPKRLEKDT